MDLCFGEGLGGCGTWTTGVITLRLGTNYCVNLADAWRRRGSEEGDVLEAGNGGVGGKKVKKSKNNQFRTETNQGNSTV